MEEFKKRVKYLGEQCNTCYSRIILHCKTKPFHLGNPFTKETHIFVAELNVDRSSLDTFFWPELFDVLHFISALHSSFPASCTYSTGNKDRVLCNKGKV